MFGDYKCKKALLFKGLSFNNFARLNFNPSASEAVAIRDESRFSNIRIFYLIIEYRLGCAIIF